MKKIIKAILILAVCFCSIFLTTIQVNAEIHYHTGDENCEWLYNKHYTCDKKGYIVVCNNCGRWLFTDKSVFSTLQEAEEAEETLIAEHLPNCRKKPKTSTSTNTANSQQLTSSQHTNPILSTIEKAGIFLLLIVGSAFSFVKR